MLCIENALVDSFHFIITCDGMVEVEDQDQSTLTRADATTPANTDRTIGILGSENSGKYKFHPDWCNLRAPDNTSESFISPERAHRLSGWERHWKKSRRFHSAAQLEA